MIAANNRIAVGFKLFEGQRLDAPQGRELLESTDFSALTTKGCKTKLLAGRTYEGDKTRELILEKGFEPVIPPKSSRKEP